MSLSEHASLQPAQARAELLKALELTLRRPDLTTAELQSACAKAHSLRLAGVCVASARILQAATFLEDSTVQVICSSGPETSAVDPDVKRYETEVAIDAGAHIIELALNPGRLRDGEDVFVLRELRDVVEAADERPVRLVLPAEFYAGLGPDRLRALAAESGVQGLVLVSSGAAADADAETVRQARAALGERLCVKLENSALTWSHVAAALQAGADRFGSTLDAEIVSQT